MGTEEDKIRKELVAKEEQLLKNSIRNDPSKIAELIEESYVEFTAAGKQINYRPGELFGTVEGELYIDSSSVKMVDLSEDCKLLLYVAAKVNKNTRIKSNHSSIWRRTDRKWKIVFHQATSSSE
jgi:hypothetical protein